MTISNEQTGLTTVTAHEATDKNNSNNAVLSISANRSIKACYNFYRSANLKTVEKSIVINTEHLDEFLQGEVFEYHIVNGTTKVLPVF